MAERKVLDSPTKSFHLFQTALIGLIILILLIALSDLSHLIAIFKKVQIASLFLAFLATLLSYFFITFSYRELFKIVKYFFSFWDLFVVTVISTLINYFIATGGISGYALRAILLKKRGVPATITFSVSLIQGVLTNISVLVLFLISLAVFMYQKQLTITQIAILIIPIVFLVFFICLILLLCFNKTISDRIMSFTEKIIRYFEMYKRVQKKGWLKKFFKIKEQFFIGIDFFKANKSKMVLPTLQVLIDWIFSIICLNYAFQSINYPLGFAFISSVYFIGIFLSFMFIATGGLGIMEGGMSAVFFEFGVPWETALAAVLIYRFVYYILPLVLILPFYISFVRSSDQKLVLTSNNKIDEI